MKKLMIAMIIKRVIKSMRQTNYIHTFKKVDTGIITATLSDFKVPRRHLFLYFLLTEKMKKKLPQNYRMFRAQNALVITNGIVRHHVITDTESVNQAAHEIDLSENNNPFIWIESFTAQDRLNVRITSEVPRQKTVKVKTLKPNDNCLWILDDIQVKKREKMAIHFELWRPPSVLRRQSLRKRTIFESKPQHIAGSSNVIGYTDPNSIR